jgi:hypothetical protein
MVTRVAAPPLTGTGGVPLQAAPPLTVPSTGSREPGAGPAPRREVPLRGSGWLVPDARETSTVAAAETRD